MCPILQKNNQKEQGQLKKKHPARNSETTQTGKPLFIYKDLIIGTDTASHEPVQFWFLGPPKNSDLLQKQLPFWREVGN